MPVIQPKIYALRLHLQMIEPYKSSTLIYMILMKNLNAVKKQEVLKREQLRSVECFQFMVKNFFSQSACFKTE